MSYRITVEADQDYFYWPFWPFKRKSLTIDLAGGFKVKVDQVDGERLSGQPIVVGGYVSTDNSTVTTSVDFNGGSRLKRVTARG
jgi:hypothetical protein